MIRSTATRRTRIEVTLLALLALALTGTLPALLSGPVEAATTFTVNKTGDAGDRRINDSVCDSSRKNGKQCTLRAAIQESNDTLGADTINFNIGGTADVKTIKPARPLPDITDPVTIDGYTQPGASENTLAEGNDAVLKIVLNGTDAGPAHGLAIQASDSTIKGLVINRFVGIGVFISGSGVTGDKVLGNFVGTSASGTEALGNGDDGVHILGEGNTVGGTAAGTRNVISGNGGDGVDFQGVNTKDNRIEGNFIGTQASSTQDLGNGEDGVNIRDGAFDNTIGGTASAAGNRIAHNGQDGVSIASGTGNSVLSNLIFSNDGLGIDLGASGVTNNDLDDPDTGANNLQNFPTITSVIQSSQIFNPTRISGTLNSNPNQNFTVQCFLGGEVPEDADPSGHGEGRAFMAEDADVTTSAGGDASFECNFLFPVSLEGKRWSATATNEVTGDTSEFSANFPVE